MSDRSNLLISSARTLWRREVVRFLRQRSRVVGALGTPIVFWLLIGSGIGRSFQNAAAGEGVPEMSFSEYFYPGTLVLIVLFTAIFSMISVIEDRKTGFMQGVLVSPAPRMGIVLGKVLGCTTLAMIQAVPFLLLAPVAGVPLSVMSFLVSAGVLLLLAVSLSGLGLLVAWPMDSTQGFHAIMNLFLMPLWLLSGAMFPASGAAGWLSWVMAINPLSYGVVSLRRAMYWSEPASVVGVASGGVALGVTITFGAVMLVLAGRVVSKERLR